jgi:hypothetical protein
MFSTKRKSKRPYRPIGTVGSRRSDGKARQAKANPVMIVVRFAPCKQLGALFVRNSDESLTMCRRGSEPADGRVDVAMARPGRASESGQRIAASFVNHACGV